MKTFMPEVNSAEELQRLQLDGLRWTVNHAYNGSALYKGRFG